MHLRVRGFWGMVPDGMEREWMGTFMGMPPYDAGGEDGLARSVPRMIGIATRSIQE